MGCTQTSSRTQHPPNTHDPNEDLILILKHNLQNFQTFSIQHDFNVFYDWKIFSHLFTQFNSLQPTTFDDVKIEYKNGQTYFGEHQNGKRMGLGKLWFKNESLDGVWEKDKVLKGKLRMKNGFEYEGQFREYLPNGKGELRKKQKIFYKGRWGDGKPEGKGRLNFMHQMYYEGEFKDGNLNGKGHFVIQGKTQIKGTFKNNQLDGKGMLKMENGHTYDGEWKKNKKDGKGIEEWPNGNVYNGFYNRGMRNGFGQLKTENGVYEGHWKNDELDEEGVWKSSGKIVRVKTVKGRTMIVNEKEDPEFDGINADMIHIMPL